MDGVFEINKASLVAQGNQQRPGIDYDELFSPVMRLESLHILLAMAAIRTYDIIQLDVTSAYLHRTLKEEQPSSFGHNPGRMHWEAAKCVLQYLKGTRSRRLVLGGKPAKVVRFADADWRSDRDDWCAVGCVALSSRAVSVSFVFVSFLIPSLVTRLRYRNICTVFTCILSLAQLSLYRSCWSVRILGVRGFVSSSMPMH